MSLENNSEGQLVAAFAASTFESRRRWIPPMPEPNCTLRLLKLPKPNPLDSDIKLELATYRLEEAPSYNALSYTWQCPVVDEREVNAWNSFKGETAVVCNDVNVPVTQNLYLGLQRIITVYPDSFFWVDALCIDQDNAVEKIAQIELMGEVYSSAKFVAVWLGPSYGQTSTLDIFYSRIPKASDALLASQRGELRPKVLKDTTIPQQHEALKQLFRLLTLRWWKRKWTYQELLLAKLPLFFCGESIYALQKWHILTTLFDGPSEAEQALSRFANSMRRSEALIKARFALHVARTDQNRKEMTTHIEKRYGRISGMAILMLLLSQTINDVATEPRDKVLSMVGIATSLASWLGQDISFDFLKTCQSDRDINMAMTRRLVLELPILDVLIFSQEETGSQQPSWVPDFRPSPHLGTLSNQTYNAGLLDSKERGEYASKRCFRPPEDAPAPLPRLEQLGLQAVRVGRISSRQYLLQFAPEGYLPLSATSDYKIIKAMMSFCGTLPARYCKEPQAIDGLLRTLFFGSRDVGKDRFRAWTTRTLVQALLEVKYWDEREQALERYASLAHETGELLSPYFGGDAIAQVRALYEELSGEPFTPARARVLAATPEPMKIPKTTPTPITTPITTSITTPITTPATAASPASAPAPVTAPAAVTAPAPTPNPVPASASKPTHPLALRRALERDRLAASKPRSDLTNHFDQTLFVIDGSDGGGSDDSEDSGNDYNRRIGITARRCRVGDEVWVVRGAEWPLVLRPTGEPDYLRLVGHAYVDGIMQGEFATAKGDGGGSGGDGRDGGNGGDGGNNGWERIWLM